MFKGWKTIAFGIGTAILPAALEYLGGVNVSKTFGLSPTAGIVVGAAIMGLRAITSTAVFRK